MTGGQHPECDRDSADPYEQVDEEDPAPAVLYPGQINDDAAEQRPDGSRDADDAVQVPPCSMLGRHVDNCGVENGHERAGQDDGEDLPRILACVVHRKRLPAAGQRARSPVRPGPGQCLASGWPWGQSRS